MKVAYYAGSFEIPHLGHVAQMNKIKELGYFLVVAVNGDEFFFENRGHNPLFSEDERALMLSESGVPDKVIVVPSMELQGATLMAVKPDVVVLGMDWLGKPLHEQYKVPLEFFQEHDIKVLYLPRASGSASEVKERVKNE